MAAAVVGREVVVQRGASSRRLLLLLVVLLLLGGVRGGLSLPVGLSLLLLAAAEVAGEGRVAVHGDRVDGGRDMRLRLAAGQGARGVGLLLLLKEVLVVGGLRVGRGGSELVEVIIVLLQVAALPRLLEGVEQSSRVFCLTRTHHRGSCTTTTTSSSGTRSRVERSFLDEEIDLLSEKRIFNEVGNRIEKKGTYS